ncbi:MAG TPA: S1C family serine protease [Caulobacteraceae bacterium]|jgi:S1-C subfamily serine protease
MSFDFTTAMIQATSPVASAPGGPALTGTGVLVSDPAPDGTPRVVLVTARHVLANIGAGPIYVGLHLKNPDGSWRLEWRSEPSSDQGRPLWTQHPTYDVAVLPISVPPEAAAAAIPASWFADADTLSREDMEAGDPVEVLGYPAGYAGDRRGFPILRLGHLASYPLTPASEGTFLVDFPVVSGNSGGPVFVSRRIDKRPDLIGAEGPQPDEFIAGIVAQQIVPGGQSIGLGLAVHSLYVRQTLQLLDRPIAPPAPVAPSTIPAPTP